MVPENESTEREEHPDIRTIIPKTVFEIAMKWLPISEYTDDHSQEFLPGNDEILNE